MLLLSLGIAGIVVGFGIIVGTLFWGVYLLEDVREKLSKVSKHLNVKVDEIAPLSDEEIEKELENGDK